MPPPKIDPSLIPAADVRLLSAAFFSAVEEFYSDPRNIRKYEQWLQQESNKNLGGTEP